MRWIKHMTDNWDDERVARLIGQGGKDGLAIYGLYWRLLEIIANGCTDTDSPSLSMPIKFWTDRCGVKPLPLTRALEAISRTGLLSISLSSETISISSEIYVRDYDNRLPRNEWATLREEIFKRDNYICQYCFQENVYLECDHVIPLCRGGSNDDSNLLTACFTCNRSKGSKTLEEWLGLSYA